MKPLRHIEGRAVSLPEADIDTDVIFPARFLVVTEKYGLGRYAFHERRADPDFVLNRAESVGAQILIGGANFGCGSSREQAPWALRDLGFEAIIAPSFGEIFFSNCFKNGVLAMTLMADEVEILHAAARAGRRFAIDLEACTLEIEDEAVLSFAIDGDRRQMLLNGWDDTDRIWALYGRDILRFETQQRSITPWLWRDEK